MGSQTTVPELLAVITSDRASKTLTGDCLRRHSSQLVSVASMHRVPGPLAAAFARMGVDIPVELQRQQEGAALARMTALHDFEFLASVLGAIDVPYLAFKGQVLTTLVGRNEWERPSLDLDVLVRVADMERAVDALVRAGSVLLDRNWDLMCERMIGEMHLLLPSGTSLDLHWHLLVNESMRDDFTPDHEALFRTARSVELDGTLVPTFGSAETLVYSCLHAAISGGHRMVSLKDIERLVDFDRPAWPDVIDVARRWRAEVVVGAMLGRTQRILGLQLPETIIPALISSRSLRLALGALDRRRPVQENTKDESLLRLVTRSIGPDLRSTIRRFASRTSAFTVGRAMHVEPPSPMALFQQGESPELRQEYFAELARRSR